MFEFFRPEEKYVLDHRGYYVCASRNRDKIDQAPPDDEPENNIFNNPPPKNLKGRFLKSGEMTKVGDLVDFEGILSGKIGGWKQSKRGGYSVICSEFYFRPLENYHIDSKGMYQPSGEGDLVVIDIDDNYKDSGENKEVELEQVAAPSIKDDVLIHGDYE